MRTTPVGLLCLLAAFVVGEAFQAHPHTRPVLLHARGVGRVGPHNLQGLPPTGRLRGPRALGLLDPTLASSALAFTQEQGASVAASLSVAETVAGGLFPLSLPPYLAFLLFLSYEGNHTPPLAMAGFRFLLVFVLGSVPAAIVATSAFGVSLADCDWLHGSAESLLTITNLLIVLGFRQSDASTSDDKPGPPMPSTPRNDASPGLLPPTQPLASVLTAVTLVGISSAAMAVDGTNPPDFFGFGVHSPFLWGLGDLPGEWVDGVVEQLEGHSEPANALTISTWVIHISSLIEWLVAMGLVWKHADRTGNPKWKRVTWGMLPLHSSGICACTYHLFYNKPSVGFLVALQAALTCVGNTTVAYAAWLLARSNGWSTEDLPRYLQGTLAWLPDLEQEGTGGVTRVAEEVAVKGDGARGGAVAREKGEEGVRGLALAGFEDLGEALSLDNDWLFVGKLVALSLAASYLVKYGELFRPFPFEDQGAPTKALLFILVPTVLNVLKWASRSANPAKSSAFDMF